VCDGAGNGGCDAGVLREPAVDATLDRDVISYYEASAGPAPDRPRLEGEVTADVCVVGGGLAGCSAALELAARGFRVVLLEARHVGFGASGRSGAQLIHGYACGQEKLERAVGPAGARALWDMSVEGIDLVRERVARHGIDCDLVWGQLHAAIKPRQEAELLTWQEELADRYGYRSTRYIGAAELGTLLETERYRGGLYDSNGGHCHPLKYTRGLAAAAHAAGARIFEESRVHRIEHGATVRLHTAHGSVRASQVVLAGNAWLAGLVPELDRKIMAVGTYIVATAPLGAGRARRLIANNMAVTDVNWVLDYFRLSADHRLLFGGRVSYSGLDPLGTKRATRARMLRVFPQLADVDIEYAWGGYVDITMSRAPHFGRLTPNVYFLQGFSGHGMVLTGMAGRVVAEVIAGQAGRFDLFARIAHRDFPGGPALRRPALVLAMLWYRLRDLL
jgi:gamma-glutamylputrescine oxidase